MIQNGYDEARCAMGQLLTSLSGTGADVSVRPVPYDQPQCSHYSQPPCGTNGVNPTARKSQLSVRNFISPQPPPPISIFLQSICPLSFTQIPLLSSLLHLSPLLQHHPSPTYPLTSQHPTFLIPIIESIPLTIFLFTYLTFNRRSQSPLMQ